MQEPGPSSAYYARFAPDANGPIRPPSPPSSPLLSASNPGRDIEALQSDSLYAILNLTRDASTSEIRDRYRALATTFHPDRQRDAASKAAAHGRFQEIQHAYEVLTDPTKRIIYDQFGEEGLRHSWDVGPRNLSPEEMRRNFAKQANEQRRLEVEALVKPKGDITTMLDARAVFISQDAFEDPTLVKHDVWSRLQRVRPERTTMSHSFEAPWNDVTQIVMTGTASNRSGKGGANIAAKVRRQFSPRLFGQAGISLLRPRTFNLKGTYVYDDDTFFIVQGAQQTLVAPPPLLFSVGRKLYSHTTGVITYQTGFYTLGPWGTSLDPRLAAANQSSLTVGVTTARPDGSEWSVETKAGLNDSQIAADWSTRLLGLKIRIGSSVSVASGITGFIDAQAKVSEYIRTSMMLQVALSGGITLQLRLSRLGQRITLPIMLTHDLNPYVLFGTTVVPAVGYLGFYRYVIQPRKRRQLADRVQELRKDHGEHIAQKRKEALEAVSVMQSSTAKKAQQEREKNGLVILEAYYGYSECFTDRGLKDLTGEGRSESYIDVTIPVQALVNDSTLVIPGGRGKYHLLGFWDPCIGESKKLRVRYMFRGKVHQVTVDDMAALRAPMKSHVME